MSLKINLSQNNNKKIEIEKTYLTLTFVSTTTIKIFGSVSGIFFHLNLIKYGYHLSERII